MIKVTLHPKLCCVELFGTTLSVGSSFTNISCGKALHIALGSWIAICISCSMTMRVDKSLSIFDYQLTFADLTLSLLIETISKYFKEDVVDLFKKDNTGFPMALFVREREFHKYTFKNIYISIYNSKNTITSMTNHQ